MKNRFIWMVLAVIGLTFVSCNKGNGEDSDYLSVQIEDSKMWSLLDVGNGKIVISDEFFAPASRVVKGSFFVETDKGEFDLYNLKDTKNRLNRSSFSVVTNFNPAGFAIVRVKEEPWQIINTEGATIATLDKNLMVMSGFLEDGLAIVKNKDEMVGYINTLGEMPIKPRYKYATIFSDGVAFVLTKQEEGHNYISAIDPTGQTLFTFSDAKYSNVSLFEEGYMFAVEGDHCVLLDKTGKKVTTVCDGKDISKLSYHNGNIIYFDGQFYGVKDIEGKILIRAKYQLLKFQSDGNLVAVNSSGKYGVININDEVQTPFDYEILEYLAPGRYITMSGKVCVLIDGSGKEICESAFSNILNRSSSASENSLSALISAKSNEASSSLEKALEALASFNMNLSDLETGTENSDDSAEMYSDPTTGLTPGEYQGIVDGKHDIVMEITSVEGNKIFGNTYYPKSVAKYGKSSQTLMPFSGTIEGPVVALIVKSPTDVTYGEDWLLTINEDGTITGSISTTTGKVWEVALSR